MKDTINFDMEAAIEALRAGKGLSGQDGILTPLIKQLTEAAMQAELEAHLASESTPNRKNGRAEERGHPRFAEPAGISALAESPSTPLSHPQAVATFSYVR